ncbi:hypothetical protein ACIHCQ_21995 [Streptomyces sp. NPDC052236]
MVARSAERMPAAEDVVAQRRDGLWVVAMTLFAAALDGLTS